MATLYCSVMHINSQIYRAEYTRLVRYHDNANANMSTPETFTPHYNGINY